MADIFLTGVSGMLGYSYTIIFFFVLFQFKFKFKLFLPLLRFIRAKKKNLNQRENLLPAGDNFTNDGLMA